MAFTTTPDRPEPSTTNLKKRSRSYSGASTTSSTAITPSRTNDSPSKKKKSSSSASTKAQPAGLRLFSMRVCEQVKAKRITTYREVADEVVKAEHARLQETGQRPKGFVDEKKKKDDDKNIRRRIYDALNVLIAMEIVTKDPKEKIIRWKGFPSRNYSDSAKLLQEKEEYLSRIQEKKEALQDLLVQNVCFRNLTLRNEHMLQQEAAEAALSENETEVEEDVPAIQKEGGTPGTGMDKGGKIPLPFIVVNTSQRAQINCEMNEDRTDVKFDFDLPFEIFNDSHILENLGLNKISYRDLSTMYPPDVLNYCIHNNLLGRILTDEPLGPNFVPSSSSYPPPPPQQQQQQLPPPTVTSGSTSGSSGAYPPPPHPTIAHPMPPSSHPTPGPYGANPVPPPQPGVYSHPGGAPPPRKGRGTSKGSSRQMYSNSGIPNENFPLW